jgi:hypothetical protein
MRTSVLGSFLLPHLALALRARAVMKATSSVASLPLVSVMSSLDNSLKRALRADPQSEAQKPNQEPREVFGQWVEVDPMPLPNPYLVAIAPAMAAELDLDPAACAADPMFAKVFAGDVGQLPSSARLSPWATPYAVSVFGHAIPSPDPFGRGNAYGDGRALSLGEFVNARTGAKWELQLKGSGRTPFSRGGDGRAVLRSSIREFLVSEAMHAMGVPTTRALCLVASGTEYTKRMWYRDDDKGRNDHPPDHLVTERCAITCRAAPSFIRVGHLELWSRRAGRNVEGALEELRSLVDHALAREFRGVVDASLPEKERLLGLVRAFAERQATLSVAWLRVGYVQGNMNSDNCLLSGRTMDYGPFGFIERYEPLWSPFTSDMERKFGFERQPLAAQVLRRRARSPRRGSRVLTTARLARARHGAARACSPRRGSRVLPTALPTALTVPHLVLTGQPDDARQGGAAATRGPRRLGWVHRRSAGVLATTRCPPPLLLLSHANAQHGAAPLPRRSLNRTGDRAG